MTRLLAASLLLLLAACGGGGGDSAVPATPEAPPVTQPPATPPPPSYAALAGVYQSDGMYANTPTTRDVRSGSIHVHPDGTIVGTLRWFQSTGGWSATEDLVTFSGSLSTGQITYTYTLRNTAAAAEPQEAKQQGAGTVIASMTPIDGAAGITVQLPPDGPFRVKAYTLPPARPLPSVYIGLPPEKLGGWMQFSLKREASSFDPWGSPINDAVVHHDAATGVITGSFGPQCHIAGKQYAYEPAIGMVRQGWTLSGSGCPVTGTAQMVGRLLGGVVLGTEVSGVFDGKWMTATLSYPLATMPTPSGAIPGLYGSISDGTNLLIHPDGTLTLTVWRVTGLAPSTASTGTFYGRLEGQGASLRAVGEYVVLNQSWNDWTSEPPPPPSSARGTATVELTLAAQNDNRGYNRWGYTVRIDSQLAVPVTEAFAAAASPPWSLGQPFERLVGFYSRGWVVTAAGTSCPHTDHPFDPRFGYENCTSLYSEAGAPMQVQLDASGAMTGTIMENCQLTGRIFDYHQALGLFRHDVTLQGSGCPVTGTAQLVGRVTWVGTGGPNLALASSGILAGQRFSLNLIHHVNKP